MKRVAALFALLLAALAGCSSTPDTSDASLSPSASVSAAAELYVCSVMPQDDREAVPLLAEGKQGARVVGQLPVDGMELGCELDWRNPGVGDFLHIVAPRSYIRCKTGVDGGWGSADDVQVLVVQDARSSELVQPKVYTGDR